MKIRQQQASIEIETVTVTEPTNDDIDDARKKLLIVVRSHAFDLVVRLD